MVRARLRIVYVDSSELKWNYALRSGFSESGRREFEPPVFHHPRADPIFWYRR